LSELWRYVGYISDAEGVKRARASIERYRDEVVSKEWPAMLGRETSTAAEDEFLPTLDARFACARL